MEMYIPAAIWYLTSGRKVVLKDVGICMKIKSPRNVFKTMSLGNERIYPLESFPAADDDLTRRIVT